MTLVIICSVTPRRSVRIISACSALARIFVLFRQASRKIQLRILCLIVLPFGGIGFLRAQDKDSLKTTEGSKIKKLSTSIYGYVRSDIFYDNRQGIGAGENVVPLYPKDRLLDARGQDINAAPKFHILSIISRLGLKIKGPDLWGAQTAGVLEGEFFGATEGAINEFRLRHAWLSINWKKTQIGIGQYWHPFVVLEALPNVVNYGTGAPVYGLNRNPQVRLTQHLFNKVRLIAVIHSQRDFTPNTLPYINAGMPALHLQLQYKSDRWVAGIAGQYENLKPKISSAATAATPALQSKERAISYSAMAYVRLITRPVSITLAAYHMQNAASYVMLGGFVGYQKAGEVEKYKSVNTQSYWMDIQFYKEKKVTAGLFAGIVLNGGVAAPLEGVATTYGVTTLWGAISATQGKRTVNHMLQIIPRLDYTPHKALKFRFEVDYRAAQWADATNKAIGTDNKYTATNWRFHLTTLFFF